MRAAPRETSPPQGPEPPVHADPGQEDVDHQLPPQGPVRLHEVEKGHGDGVEGISTGQRLQEGGTAQDDGVPQGKARGLQGVGEEGPGHVPQRQRVLSHQHLIGEDEFPEEPQRHRGEDHQGQPEGDPVQGSGQLRRRPVRGSRRPASPPLLTRPPLRAVPPGSSAGCPSLPILAVSHQFVPEASVLGDVGVPAPTFR